MVSPNDSRTSLGRKDKEFCEGTKQERQIRRTLHVSLDRAEAVINGMTIIARTRRIGIETSEARRRGQADFRQDAVIFAGMGRSDAAPLRGTGSAC